MSAIAKAIPPGSRPVPPPPGAETDDLVPGELIAANLGLRCCPCTDNAIINDTPLDDVPAAFTMAPSVQTFTANGQTIMAPVVLPVCIDCRKRQMGVVSKTGLMVS